MISTGSIYYDEIHRRAEADKWQIELLEGRVSFEDWKKHWIATAYKWQGECITEGLNNTADHIAQIIEANK